MKLWKVATVVAISLVAIACSSDDDGTTKAGNSEVCGAGETCVNQCDEKENGCSMSCATGSNCKATCRAGQDCSFACDGDAECEFDCTQGSCSVSSSSPNCSCTGDCVGTCGGVSGVGGTGGAGGATGTGGTGGTDDPGTGGTGLGGSAGTAGTGLGGSAGTAGAGGNIADCIAACDPTSPDYIDCVTACQD